VALPRVRDFRGISDKAFDGRGNYSLGLREHTIFPELNLDKVERIKGLTVTINTTARWGCRSAARWSAKAPRARPRIIEMAKTCLRVKAQRKPKFKTRQHNRCPL